MVVVGELLLLFRKPACLAKPNMTIRTLIVDDEPLARDRIRSLLKNESEVEVIGECGDGASAIQTIKNKKPDLVLLDIQLPEMGGFEIIESLDKEEVPAIIFTTAYDAFAVKAFKVHALDYLLKPVSAERLHEALTRVRALNPLDAALRRDLIGLLREIRPPRPTRRTISVKTETGVLFLRAAEIDWAESAGSYVCFHVGSQTHVSRETMRQAEHDLLEHNFIRIHRSTIVNLDRIRKLKPLLYGEYAVELRDGTTLAISRGYKEQALRKLGNPST